jgi:predicted ATPase/class 3 adenylate cyclase
MALPTGPSVTFLFTDIESSTRLERAVGSAAWATLVARHDRLLRDAIEGHGGIVVKTEGDAFFAAFDRPASAMAAAVAAQRGMAGEAWTDDLDLRVRMGLHLGEGRLRHGRTAGEPEDYVGIDVNYAARIAAAGNGGQIVLSEAVVQGLGPRLRDVAGLEDVELVDEGLRAVKDFDEPARLHRLVVPGAADDGRPLRTLEFPSNLPGDVTELVGRESEIERLGTELVESRIVTLTGPGGGGKTRLALGVARSVRSRYPHGTWFVDLAAVRDPSLLDSEIATTLAVRESPDRVVGQALLAHLRDRTTLLVLDNLEQLLPAGAETVARLVRGAPGLRVLVTSREVLRIAGERGHPVPPLGLESGVELFEARARSVRADLVLTEESRAAIRAICDRLGGLPLAIELAAARTRLLSPAQILERLGRSLDLSGGTRDVPERQRTLRGAIAWSHDLLSEEERRLFARLAVFAGGCTTDAAASVGDVAGDLGMDLVAGLESLADKSLIRIEPGDADAASPDAEPRFSFHPLLREFALERLEASGERPAIEARLAAVCVALAEEIGPAILGTGGDARLRRLDREEHNIRAAVDWALANDEAKLGLRIVGSIWRWFHLRGRLREGRALLAQLLDRTPDVDVRLRITGLTGAGGLAYWMNDFPAARAAYEERLELATSTGDQLLMADAHYDVGFLSMVAQESELVREHEHRALDLYTAAGQEDGRIRARQALALGLFLTGDFAAARELSEESLAAFQRMGSQFEIADMLTFLSATNWRVGDEREAWRRMTVALRYFAEVDSASGLVRAMAMAAIILLADEKADAELGARLTGATYRLVREKGVMIAPVHVLHLPDPRDLATERLGAKRAAALLADGDAADVGEIVAEILGAPGPW